MMNSIWNTKNEQGSDRTVPGFSAHHTFSVLVPARKVEARVFLGMSHRMLSLLTDFTLEYNNSRQF